MFACAESVRKFDAKHGKHEYHQNDPGSGALRSDKLFVSSYCENYAQAASLQLHLRQ